MKKLIVASFILVVSATPAQSQTAPDHPAVVVHGQTVHAAVDL